MGWRQSRFIPDFGSASALCAAGPLAHCIWCTHLVREFVKPYAIILSWRSFGGLGSPCINGNRRSCLLRDDECRDHRRMILKIVRWRVRQHAENFGWFPAERAKRTVVSAPRHTPMIAAWSRSSHVILRSEHFRDTSRYESTRSSEALELLAGGTVLRYRRD